MLVARKPYSGKAVLVDPKRYRCVPADLDRAREGLVTHEDFLERKLAP